MGRACSIVILLQLGDDESDNSRVKEDVFRCVGEQRAELFARAHFAEQLFHAILDFFLARFSVAFVGIPNGKARPTFVLFVFDFGEQ